MLNPPSGPRRREGACRRLLGPCSGALFWALLSSFMAKGQWAITAIHPDPTPVLGAPGAEFVALIAQDAADSCCSLAGFALAWNGHFRELPAGCWPAGTVLVVHRAADSAEFDFGTALSLPLASWPALVNGGGMVVLQNAEGTVVDAMTYSEEALGGGGRPVMRSGIRACGGPLNQHLWSPGMSPFFSPVEQDVTALGSVDGAIELAEARRPERIVARGRGMLEWYLGSSFDPVSMELAKAWVGGGQVALAWPSDSVARMEWDWRISPLESTASDAMPVVIGPLKTCVPGAQPRMFAGHHPRQTAVGDIRAVGVMPDPIPGDPFQSEESFTLFNAGVETVDLGPWSFGGARLRRSKQLSAGGTVQLHASEFEDWPGMSNAGGAMLAFGPEGAHPMALNWAPCDHDLPSHVGSGLGLRRSAAPGSDWHTEGHPQPAEEPVSIVGFGCISDLLRERWVGLDIHLNRYPEHISDRVWRVAGSPDEVMELELQGEPRAIRLTWEGAENQIESPEGVRVQLEGDAWNAGAIVAHCPDLLPASLTPCLRIGELMWDAETDGAEFAELINCGMEPIDLSGLQATTETDPMPGDWRTWVPGSVSLVLNPGEVMAFGPCARWVGQGWPAQGPSRWSVEHWSALNDAEGRLSIRLPSVGPEVLDEVHWNGELQGPWWWSRDGWAWARSGSGPGDWSPARDRGSPGRPQEMLGLGDCAGGVWFESSCEGGLPGIAWSFPEAGGILVIRLVGWPSGALLTRIVLQDLLTQGSWAWNGLLGQGPVPETEQVIWDVQWMGGQCAGRNRWSRAR